MANLPTPSIPLKSAALCADCLVIFDMADGRCSKCDSELGWTAIESNRAATFIKAQRDLIDEAEGVLLTIAKRHLGPSSLFAWRMVDRIRTHKQKAPVAAGAVIGKEVQGAVQ